MSETEEEVIVKPSTELIPDEYECQNAKDILVHIFAEDKKNVHCFIKKLQAMGYIIPTKNVHDINSDNCYNILEDIKTQTKGFKGLMILFSGHTLKEGEIIMYDMGNNRSTNVQKVCMEFDSQHCPNLRNCPKIFIFEVRQKQELLQTDYTAPRSGFQTPYDTPSEADLLIIYNKYDDDCSYLQQLTNNIETYGEDEDIVTIASCVSSSDFRPLIISTMTRKFFFTCNIAPYRGNHYKTLKCSQQLGDFVKKLNQDIERKLAEIGEAMRPRSSSFRRDQADRPNPSRASATRAKKTSNPDEKPPWR